MEAISLRELLRGVAAPGFDAEITGVVTDSRAAGPGRVFVAIRGERVDGHDYAAKALAAGAAAVIAEHAVAGADPARVFAAPDGDAREALIRMAANYRARYAPVVLGVTGSVGKTTTKEFCAAVFAAFGETVATEGNQNNEIGVPNTLFRLGAGTRYAVVEMGMDHMGDLHRLSPAVRPAAAVITRIGVSHIENLGSQDNILTAKMQVCDGLPDDGLLVVNGDDERLAAVAAPRQIRKVCFGVENPCAEVRACAIMSNTQGQSFTICDRLYGDHDVTIPAVGRHNVYNALAAYTAATRLGLDAAAAAAALSAYRTTGMRQKLIERGGVQLIEDCYNANPDSMKAALEALGAIAGGGRRAAVLGDMLELGRISDAAHLEVGREAAAYGVDLLVTFGAGGALIARGARQAGAAAVRHCESKQQAAEVLRGWCRPGDTVLFKASRGMKFEEIAELYNGGPL